MALSPAHPLSCQSPVVSVAVSPTPGGSLILSGDDSGGLFLSTLEGHIKGALIGHKV